jgi:putative N6-adenine-specific DNA methylase
VYIKVGEFNATTFDQLFDGVKNVDWENYLPDNALIRVNGKCVKSQLFAISACQSIVKKAIVDRMCNKYNLIRLNENGASYDVEFSVFKDVVSLYINTSGMGLHKRGYRDLVGIAPIKETLASALVLLSDFYKNQPFADPFCGSGTIAIEAARIAMNIAGGIGRRFAFNDWKNFDQKYFDEAFTEAKDKEDRSVKLEMFASDIDPKAVKLAERHAQRAGVYDKIKFKVCDVKDFKCDLSCGTIVSNPPYIPTRDIASLSAEVHQEPYSALDGGDDGLVFYKRFIEILPAKLNPGGAIIFEIGYDQKEALLALRKSAGLTHEFFRDYGGNVRGIVITCN